MLGDAPFPSTMKAEDDPFHSTMKAEDETINQPGNTSDKNRIIGNRFGSRLTHPAHPPSWVP